MAICLAALIGATPSAQAQACLPTGTNQTCTNSVFLDNTVAAGISDSGTVTVTNTSTGVIGLIGGQNGIETTGGAANVTNAGGIAGVTGVFAHTDAVVTNSGTISGALGSISALTGKVTVDNSGTLSSGGTAIFGQTGINLTNSGSVTSSAGATLFAATGDIGVSNSGTISSTSFSIFGNGNVTVANSGTISGQAAGIFANGASSTLTVNNSGVISSVNGFGIEGNGTAVNVVNSGTISDGGAGTAVSASKNLTLTNSGTITGFNGVLGRDLTLSNTGTISGSNFAVLHNGGFGNIVNAGTITSANFALITSSPVSVTNSGTIAGGMMAILASQGGTFVNSGTITGGQSAISSFGSTSLTNSGTIRSSLIAISFGGANSNFTIANSGTIAGQDRGIFANGASSTLTVNNSGVISAVAGSGIEGNGTSVSVVNSGTITGFNGVRGSDLTLNNTGSIFGSNFAVFQTGGFGNIVNAGAIVSTNFALITSSPVNVTNTGTIAGGMMGILASQGGTFVNSGTITGGQSAISSFGSTNLTNSGTISGSLVAISFGGANGVLTLLPGSRIIGAINLNTSATINFRGGNHNLTFNSLAGATVTGTTPFAVSGNQAAAIDVTPFAAQGRALNDFSREAAGAIPLIPAGTSPGSGPLAYAAPDPSSRVNDAFAAIPGVVAGANDAMVFKNPTVVYEDGSAVWARGFAGQRVQQADGPLFRTVNLFYGGMIGGDIRVRPDLRLGAFAGVGQTRTSIDFSGGLNSDVTFGGLYAQYDSGATFLRAVLQAGGSNNFTTRSINNNLVAGGLETATASFNGWYINPELTIGQRVAIGNLAGASYTLTPTLRLRYLYGSYDGYTENGSTANLTMGSRSVSTVEERGELKLTRMVTFSPSSQLASSIYGGFLGTQRAGDSAINAALLGQAIPFATPGPANVWGGFGGLGLEWRTRNVTLFSTAEYLGLSDNSALVSGRAGLRVGF